MTRKDGNKITWEIADDHKHNCLKCRKGKVIEEFVIYGSRYKSKLSKKCKICIDYHRKEDEKCKKGEFKDEWNWNGHLTI